MKKFRIYILNIFVILLISTSLNCKRNEDYEDDEADEVPQETYNFNEGGSGDELAQNELAKDLYYRLGFDKKTEITKQDFSDYFFRLITKEKDPGAHRQFFDGIINGYTKTLPSKMKASELATYLVYDKFIKVIEEVIRVQYGEQYVAQLRDVFDSFKKKPNERSQDSNEKENENKQENEEEIKNQKDEM
jgi:hypothetical protein